MNNSTSEQFTNHIENHKFETSRNVEAEIAQINQKVLNKMKGLRDGLKIVAMPAIIKVLKEMPQLKFVPEPMLKLLVNALISKQDKHHNPFQDAIFDGIKKILGDKKMLMIYEKLDDILRKIQPILSQNKDGLVKLADKFSK